MTIQDHDLRSSRYVPEHVDRLPFNTPEKSDRYRTERYQGATGLNWYTSDPTIQFLMRYYLTPDEYTWSEAHLTEVGALIGGPVSERADQTDKNPPKLERYDKWGHEISHVHIPESAQATKRDIHEHGIGRSELRQQAQRAGVRLGPAQQAQQYMLCQAEVGMVCALGADAGMVGFLAARYAPPEVAELVTTKLASGEWAGKTAQLLTERTGGSDLGQIETTATPDGDAWRLNGFKWFASNCDGEAYVVLAKPEGAPDSVKGTASFLVLRQRRDGARNGVRIRQLKDKLGTKAVASGEVEFVDAEAFLMAPSGEGALSKWGTHRHGQARIIIQPNLRR
jgi:acyl-CoA dehydrogenase